MKTKLIAAAGLAAAVVLGTVAPAVAHVTTNPESARMGGEITLGFRFPNEMANANTTQVEIDFDMTHPVLGIDVQPVPGWTAKVTSKTLSPPVQTDDGPVTQAVSQIVWSGGLITPGQYQEFPVLAQRLPTDTDQAVFKALQTYSNGTIVRWIDPVVAGQPAPANPTPILKLTADPKASGGNTTTTTAGTATTAATSTPTPTSTSAPQVALNPSKLAKQSSVDTAVAIAIAGLAVGVTGLVVAIVALASRRRPTT
jgi:periplasmic copper chaperone A